VLHPAITNCSDTGKAFCVHHGAKRLHKTIERVQLLIADVRHLCFIVNAGPGETICLQGRAITGNSRLKRGRQSHVKPERSGDLGAGRRFRGLPVEPAHGPCAVRGVHHVHTAGNAIAVGIIWISAGNDAGLGDLANGRDSIQRRGHADTGHMAGRQLFALPPSERDDETGQRILRFQGLKRHNAFSRHPGNCLVLHLYAIVRVSSSSGVGEPDQQASRCHFAGRSQPDARSTAKPVARSARGFVEQRTKPFGAGFGSGPVALEQGQPIHPLCAHHTAGGQHKRQQGEQETAGQMPGHYIVAPICQGTNS
jgi:hypothetical protein